ncbi:Unknown protein sequence [Pseudomonas syringae pv. maculicola]|nr:Unknown protein sequence [Pseudomonas syringae pv. maculicola]
MGFTSESGSHGPMFSCTYVQLEYAEIKYSARHAKIVEWQQTSHREPV